MKTLAQAVSLGDPGQIAAVAIQYGYKVTRTRDYRGETFTYYMIAHPEMHNSMFYFRVTNGNSSIWNLHYPDGKVLVDPKKTVEPTPPYVVREILLLEES